MDNPKMELNPIDNPRTLGGEFKYPDLKCEKCGCVTSAYIGISIPTSIDDWEKTIICKGCLTEAINIINKAILKECQ